MNNNNYKDNHCLKICANCDYFKIECEDMCVFSICKNKLFTPDDPEDKYVYTEPSGTCDLFKYKPHLNKEITEEGYGEPWSCAMDHKGRIIIFNHGNKILAGWARRAAICVNACAGIPSEELTPSRIKKGIALARALETDDPEVFLTMHEVALRRAGINKPLEGSLK